jgi:hypothetical protein
MRSILAAANSWAKPGQHVNKSNPVSKVVSINEAAVPKDIRAQFEKELDEAFSSAIIKKALVNLKENLGDSLDKTIYAAIVEDAKKALDETKNEILSIVDSVNAIDIDLLPTNQDREDSAGVEIPDEADSADIDAEGNKEFE